MHKSLGALGALVAVCLVCAPPATAQIAKLPEDVQKKIAAMGPVLTPDLVRDTMVLFRPLALPAKSLDSVAITRDVSYGPDPRNKLDVFVLKDKLSEAYGTYREDVCCRPVVIFIPGGGFVGGDKHSNDAIYANVGVYFAHRSIVAVIANYRLAPQSPWPAGAEDVGKVVAWVKANITTYYGDPNRVFLMGHSAGATHVASYVLDPSLHPKEGAGVVAAILVSGFYRVSQDHLAPNITAYFGSDAGQFATRSPITHVGESKLPLFLAVAEYDPPFLETPTLELAAAVCARDGKCPRLAWLKGHNNISELASFNTRDRALGSEIVDFVRGFR